MDIAICNTNILSSLDLFLLQTLGPEIQLVVLLERREKREEVAVLNIRSTRGDKMHERLECLLGAVGVRAESMHKPTEIL